MKIIAENHAADFLRTDARSAPAPLMLDAIACDLRALYGSAAVDLPDRLVTLVRRLESEQPRSTAQSA